MRDRKTGEEIRPFGYDLDDRGAPIRRMLSALTPGKDFGANPIGDGTFRMVPSGDVVTADDDPLRASPGRCDGGCEACETGKCKGMRG